MEQIYTSVIEPVLEGDVKKHIHFFRKLRILKRHMTCLFCKTQMDEVTCSKIKDKCVFKCYTTTCDKYKTIKSIRSCSYYQHYLGHYAKSIMTIILYFLEVLVVLLIAMNHFSDISRNIIEVGQQQKNSGCLELQIPLILG